MLRSQHRVYDDSGEVARTQDVWGAEGISGRVKFLPLAWAGMPKTSFRKNSDSPLFTPLVTLKAFIFQVLSTDGSCRQAVNHVLSERLYQGCSANSIKTGAYCKARKRLPHKQLKQAVESSGKTLHQQAYKAWLWKGHNTALTDGTTVLMPDTSENQTDYPQQSN